MYFTAMKILEIIKQCTRGHGNSLGSPLRNVPEVELYPDGGVSWPT